MMNYIGLLIAICVSLFVSSVMMYNQKNNKEATYDSKQIIVIFVITFIIVYLLYILITDVNDNDEIFNNIKAGEPPF